MTVPNRFPCWYAPKIYVEFCFQLRTTKQSSINRINKLSGSGRTVAPNCNICKEANETKY